MGRARTSVSLGAALLAVAGTMAVGAALKAPCASGDWSDLRQYRLLCYSDIVPLLVTEQLQQGRLPFLDPCDPVPGRNCDEYPVLTMAVMRLAAWVGGSSYATFFVANAAILAIAAGVAAAGLWAVGGRRALWFALAPSLLLTGLVNWDLVPVALATGALVAFAARRDGWAGVLLGLGAAAKLYPALFVVPLVVQRVHERQPDRAVRVLWGAAGAWTAVNLPFALASPASWWEFFRFNASRGPDWDSLWYIACRADDRACWPTGSVNLASAVLAVALAGALWWWKARRSPGFARWSLGLPILVAFLLANKVYSPQYSLWLLPWLALALPSLPPFVAFSVADVAVFVTRFSFFGTLSGAEGAPQWAFELAVLARALALAWCVADWLRRDTAPSALDARGWAAWVGPEEAATA
jgi:uncharacterized membrane protein